MTTRLLVGTFLCFRTGARHAIHPESLYRGVPRPLTRESIAKHNDRVADTGERAYPLPKHRRAA